MTENHEKVRHERLDWVTGIGERDVRVNTTLSALIASAEGGDESAAKALFAALYAELHRMARRELARAGGGHLGATTLLHERISRSRVVSLRSRIAAASWRTPHA
jgi:hypothetical protein